MKAQLPLHDAVPHVEKFHLYDYIPIVPVLGLCLCTGKNCVLINWYNTDPAHYTIDL